MFIRAAGYAPVRAAASQAMEVASSMDLSNVNDVGQDSVVRYMIVSTLLISNITLVIAPSWKLCQQQRKPQTQDQIAQTSPHHDRRVIATGAQDATEDIFVYPQGRRFHTRWNCRAVTGAKSQPRQYPRCQVCGQT
eukprot:5633008-Amphidinium_carterae.1